MKLTPESPVLVQGITEIQAAKQVELMTAYGTKIVAGISPGEGGQELQGIQIFDMVEQALPVVGAVDTTIIFVPPYLALDAALEAIAAGIRQIVLISEGIPPLDMVHLIRKAEATETMLVGPNSPGIIIPEKLLLGTHPTEIYTPGKVGIISRCSTLTYEVALQLTQAGLGQSISIGIGGDAIVGSSFAQWLEILDEDDNTEVIVLVGDNSGNSEEIATRYITEAIDKPVIAYIAGRHAPPEKILGHANTIIASFNAELSTEVGRVESKLAAFAKAKIPVAERPSEIPALVKKALKKKRHK